MSENGSIRADDVADLILGHSRMCFATRAKEYKTQAFEDLERLRVDLDSRKASFIAKNDEDQANLTLSLDQLALSVQSELQMWLNLAKEDGDAAWASLIRAQTALRTSIQAHPYTSKFDHLPRRLYFLEKLLFPPQIFFSPGIIIKKAVCSICHLDYEDCEHIVGRPYLGQICAREIMECEIEEISVVPSPANKLARAFTFTEGGVTRNVMSWRESDSTPSGQPHPEEPDAA